MHMGWNPRPPAPHGPPRPTPIFPLGSQDQLPSSSGAAPAAPLPPKRPPQGCTAGSASSTSPCFPARQGRPRQGHTDGLADRGKQVTAGHVKGGRICRKGPLMRPGLARPPGGGADAQGQAPAVFTGPGLAEWERHTGKLKRHQAHCVQTRSSFSLKDKKQKLGKLAFLGDAGEPLELWRSSLRPFLPSCFSGRVHFRGPSSFSCKPHPLLLPINH